MIQTQSVEEFKQSAKVEIQNPGIKRTLSKYNPIEALAEYVWNGFDAGATIVDIDYVANDLTGLDGLTVSDNGCGIPRLELIKKFTPILHSDKLIDPNVVKEGPSSVHGEDGIGRLTFFKFANLAKWETTYRKADEKFSEYGITITSDRLNTYTPTTENDSTGPSGTRVSFLDITELSSGDFERIEEFFVREFACILELKSPCEKQIRINGKAIKHDDLIADKKTFTKSIGGYDFEIRYVRWSERPNNEYSRYYFVASNNSEKTNKTTSLNNKGDGFHHSVYIKSDFFDSVRKDVILDDKSGANGQQSLDIFGDNQKREIQKELISEVENFLRDRKKPFLRERSAKIVENLKKDNAFPKFSSDAWEQHKKRELEGVVRELYEVEPKIFSNLNIQQKQTLVRLFDLVMNSSERDNLMEVLGQIVNLEGTERRELADLLKSNQLSNIIATIKMINDRFTAINELECMVYDKAFFANERGHLQTHIEHHYWVLGEQYNLVTSAEAKFEKALREYLYLLDVEEDLNVKIEHKDKNKEMDIFAFRQLPLVNRIDNIVLELMHPLVKLSRKHLDQVKTYMSVILKQKEFNASDIAPQK